VSRTTYGGAKTIMQASISPNVGASGGYYSDMVESRTRSSTQGETGKQFAEKVAGYHRDIEEACAEYRHLFVVNNLARCIVVYKKPLKEGYISFFFFSFSSLRFECSSKLNNLM
jgi:hypothetical protein